MNDNGNVIPLDVPTKAAQEVGDLSPRQVLREMMDIPDLKEVLVLAINSNDQLLSCCTTPNLPIQLYMLEIAKLEILHGGDDEAQV